MNARKKLNELKKNWGFSTDGELATKLGTAKTNIDSWVKRDKIPEKWQIIIEQNQNKIVQNVPNENLITINLYENIHASAGYGVYNSDIVPKPMQFDKNFLRQFLNITSFVNLDIIRVTGDSMLPLIKDGEYIVVQKEVTPKNGDTVIANISGEIYVKRYYKIPFEQWIRLESENKEYPDINIDTEDKLEALQIVGIVKSKIKLY